MNEEIIKSQYEKQVDTFKQRYGHKAYANNGFKGGKARKPMSSEKAAEMARKRWGKKEKTDERTQNS